MSDFTLDFMEDMEKRGDCILAKALACFMFKELADKIPGVSEEELLRLSSEAVERALVFLDFEDAPEWFTKKAVEFYTLDTPTTSEGLEEKYKD